MKKNRSLGNSLLLLATPLVASLSIGISPSNAATIASSGIEPSSEKTIYGSNEFTIVASQQIFDRPNFSIEDLLNSTGDDIDNSRSNFGNHLKSILGDVSVGINDFFAPNVEMELTPLTSVNTFRSDRVNIQAIDSSQDPLRVLLKSFQSLQESEREKNQFPVTSDTESTQPIEINPSPVAEDPVVKEPSQNKSATTPTPTSIESPEPLTSEERQKIAQLPKAMSTIDKEVKSLFDPLQIIGGALALGFVVWMLMQD